MSLREVKLLDGCSLIKASIKVGSNTIQYKDGKWYLPTVASLMYSPFCTFNEAYQQVMYDKGYYVGFTNDGAYAYLQRVHDTIKQSDLLDILHETSFNYLERTIDLLQDIILLGNNYWWKAIIEDAMLDCHCTAYRYHVSRAILRLIKD